MEQTIYLLLEDHQDFERFLFGFTTQRGSSDTQIFQIDQFNSSFIRHGPDDNKRPGLELKFGIAVINRSLSKRTPSEIDMYLSHQ